MKRTSFAYVEKNPELVSCGSIVLVRDSKNNIAPYIVPKTKFFGEEKQLDIGIIIEQIIVSLKIIAKLSGTSLILIEGQDSLDDVVDKYSLPKNIWELPSLLMETANSGNMDGVVVSTDGVINKLSLSQYSIEELTDKTDSIAIVLEDDQSITIMVDGVPQHDYDFIMLRSSLYSCLESKNVEIGTEKSPVVECPSKHELEKMSDYELVVLMKSYKFNKHFDYYHTVRKELIKRKKEQKQSKKNKIELKQKKYYMGEE